MLDGLTKRVKSLANSTPSFEADPRVAAVVDSIRDVYYVIDRDWRVVLLNEAAAAFVGRPRAEIVGRSLRELYDAASSPLTALIEAAMGRGEAGQATAVSTVHPDRVIDFRVAPLGEGRVAVSLVDVTERAQAEQGMRESRERLDLAVAAHRIGIYDWHMPSGRIVWSPELEEIFGLEPGTFEGTAEAFRRRVLPDDFASAQAETGAALAEGRDLIGFHFRIRREDGAIRWIEGVSRVVYAADGTPERIVGTNFDVTERVQAEQDLRESRDRLDLAVGAHDIGIFDWHLPSGRLVWSAEQRRIFGAAPEAFGGDIEDFRRRVAPEDLSRVDSLLDEAIAARRDVVRLSFRIRRPDGEERWLEGVGRVVYGAGGEAERVVGTNIDVTERMVAERHQRLLINELNHRVKNTLAIVQAIAWQSFRSGGMSKTARESFEGRLAALAAAHDVITRRNWEAGSIDRIVCGALTPHDPGDGRVRTEGPTFDLEPKTAVALALAVHELATNAVKHGALSTSCGQVDVRWANEDGRLRLTWRETGGPPITQPVARGFGARLLERGLAEELGGAVRLAFPPEGVVCEVEAPLAS